MAIQADEAVALHLAREKPSHWAELILDLARRTPDIARIEADKVRCKEIDEGFPRSALCLVATQAINVIDRQTGTTRPLGGPLRASLDFYHTPLSWTVSGRRPFTPH